LSVDEATWDGADFLNLDENPNIVVVTERVADVVKSLRVANVAVFGPV